MRNSPPKTTTDRLHLFSSTFRFHAGPRSSALFISEIVSPFIAISSPIIYILSEDWCISSPTILISSEVIPILSEIIPILSEINGINSLFDFLLQKR